MKRWNLIDITFIFLMVWACVVITELVCKVHSHNVIAKAQYTPLSQSLQRVEVLMRDVAARTIPPAIFQPYPRERQALDTHH